MFEKSQLYLRSPLAPLDKATVYTQITKTINFLAFAPLTPQFWGELEDASLFFSGDLGGGNAVNISQPDLCVHGSLIRGEITSKSPLVRGI